MSTNLGEIYGGFLPKISLNYLLIFIAMAIFLAFSYWMYKKNKGKVQYVCYIFEKVGKDFRMRKSKLIRNISVKDNTFHLARSNTMIPVSMKNAVLTRKGKVAFFLIEQDDTFIPMNVTDKTQSGKTIGELMAEYNLPEVKKALTESVEKDNKSFAWVDKWSPLLNIVVPMVTIIIAFIILGMSMKNVNTLVDSNNAVVTAFNGVAPAFKEVANDFGELIEYVKTGRVSAIPPG